MAFVLSGGALNVSGSCPRGTHIGLNLAHSSTLNGNYDVMTSFEHLLHIRSF